MDIDVLYCRSFMISSWDKPRQKFEGVLLPDDMAHNDAILLPFLRKLSYGTIEIETDMMRADFDKIIDENKLPKNIDRKTFMGGLNAYLTNKRIWETIIDNDENLPLNENSIKGWHAAFMQGVAEHSGAYSKKQRVMGKLEDFQTTLPEDIPEEMNRWVYKYATAATLSDIAKGHAHFIAIHPFGDGNGRVGRALVMIQCLSARLKPPIFDGDNRAMYYAAMEHAMRHGRYIPLLRLFHEASEAGVDRC